LVFAIIIGKGCRAGRKEAVMKAHKSHHAKVISLDAYRRRKQSRTSLSAPAQPQVRGEEYPTTDPLPDCGQNVRENGPTVWDLLKELTRKKPEGRI